MFLCTYYMLSDDDIPTPSRDVNIPRQLLFLLLFCSSLHSFIRSLMIRSFSGPVVCVVAGRSLGGENCRWIGCD